MEDLDIEKEDDLSDVLANPKLPATSEKKMNEFLAPLFVLRSQLESTLNQLPKPTPTRTAQQEVWGKLYPQFSGHPPVLLSGPIFTIGRNPRCNLTLKDTIVNGVLCRIHYQQGKAFVESVSGSGILSLNQRILRKQAKLQLRSGDEISIVGNQTYSFMFHQTPKTATNKPESAVGEEVSPSKIRISSPVRFRSFESKPTDSKLISSFSSPISTRSKDSIFSIALGSVATPGTPTTHDTENLSSPMASLGSSSTILPDTTIPSTPLNLSLSVPLPAPPMLDIPSDDKPSEKDAESSVEKGLEFKTQLIQKIEGLFLKPEDMQITFDSFPYYLHPHLQNLLVNTVYLYLEKPEFSKYAKSIPMMSRRILLSGQKGTQILQEKLVQALAKHFNAKMLILDDCFQDNQKMDADVPIPPPTTLSILEDLAAAPGFDQGHSHTAIGNPRCSFKKGDKVKYVGSSGLGSGNPVPGNYSGFVIPLRDEGSTKRALALTPGSTFSSSAGTRISGAGTTRLGPSVGFTGKVMLTFDDNPRKVGVRFDKPIPGGINLGNLCEDNHGFFIDASELKHEHEPAPEESADCLTIEVLFETLNKEENQPCIVFIKNFEKTVLVNYERYLHLKKELEKLEGRTVFIASSTNITGKDKADRPGFLLSSKSSGGSHTALLDLSFLDHLSRIEERKETTKASKIIAKLFPCKISTHPPKNQNKLVEWQKMISVDRQKMKTETNLSNLKKVLAKNSLTCDNLEAVNMKKKVFSRTQIDKVIGWALSDHIMKAKDLKADKDTLSLDAKSISLAFKMLDQSNPKKTKSIYDIETDNDFEKRLLSDVIPPNELKIGFDDIGALDKIKDTLKELVMLPLQRPELFRKGNLNKPCKGILLFGPPGTGKTMLAKAVATESGANFISISMASIGSKWFGEGEKYSRAVFTLASKISPCVIFIDEVDCILGRRENHGEHEAMRKIKNELMMMWDGLKTRQNERVLVLAATNRPFDLDEAVLRRLQRKLLVDLPDAENRLKILKVILKNEDLSSSVDLAELAKITEGYSGSDLNNLCMAAAYQPIREHLRNEKKELQKKTDGTAEKAEEIKSDSVLKKDEDMMDEDKEGLDIEEKETPPLRSLLMSDFTNAMKEISSSVSENAHAIAELRKWNEMYGEGGSRKNTPLPYFT
eukprot:TRINITY_DN9717_c0_g1_i1.p1 TRINITY_DN9717_c0_g1~~TRINITY_DN9717_c0_g1_i1.p1  ORF type:complete len:1346 (+),score=342.86 TRINITY_DN9717_c0_g1_i1:552-4040(+)